MISWPETQRLGALSVLDSHLHASVEAPSLLFLLCRRGIEPHKAIIPQDNGRTTWQIVEMCFLPLDQGWRELHEDALAQLMDRKRSDEGQREGRHQTFGLFPVHIGDLPFHTLNCECGETVLRQQRWIAPRPAKCGKKSFQKRKRKNLRGVAREKLYFHYTDKISLLKVFSHGKLILSWSPPLKHKVRVRFRWQIEMSLSKIKSPLIVKSVFL